MTTILKENLQEKLIQVVQETDALRVEIAKSRSKINEYCAHEINKVDTSIETNIEKVNDDKAKVLQLNEQRKKWLAEIGEYEQECVKYMEATRSRLIEYIDKVRQWAKRVLERRSSDTFLVELNEQTEKHLSDLRHLLLQIKAFQLGGRQLMFIEAAAIDEIKIGRIQIHEMKLPSILLDEFSRICSLPMFIYLK
jgi:hypothetical protein